MKNFDYIKAEVYNGTGKVQKLIDLAENGDEATIDEMVKAGLKVKAVWFSRHDLSPDQLAGLSNAMGNIPTSCFDVIKVRKAIHNPADAARMAELQGADLLLVMLPIRMLSELLNHIDPIGCPVLVPETDRRQIGNNIEFIHLAWVRYYQVIIQSEIL